MNRFCKQIVQNLHFVSKMFHKYSRHAVKLCRASVVGKINIDTAFSIRNVQNVFRTSILCMLCIFVPNVLGPVFCTKCVQNLHLPSQNMSIKMLRTVSSNLHKMCSEHTFCFKNEAKENKGMFVHQKCVRGSKSPDFGGRLPILGRFFNLLQTSRFEVETSRF